MPLNKQSGNMYPWVTHTWNPARGCAHNCRYCYLRTLEKHYGRDMTTPRFVEGELRTRLGSGNTIFVCSTADLFGSWVTDEQMSSVLEHCRRFDNTYLFQSKSPARMHQCLGSFPAARILGATIETNRTTRAISEAPEPIERAKALVGLPGRKMVSIEPVLDFDLAVLVTWIQEIDPEFVSIGADSKKTELPEPSSEKVRELIGALQRVTEVRVKDNLKRLGGTPN